MAAYHISQEYFTLGGTLSSGTVGGSPVDYSTQVTAAALKEAVNKLDFTNMGSNAHSQVLAGLETDELTLTFNHDYAASKIDALWRSSKFTHVVFEWRPTQSARSATNPAACGYVLLSEWEHGGKVGDLATVSVTWQISVPPAGGDYFNWFTA